MLSKRSWLTLLICNIIAVLLKSYWKDDQSNNKTYSKCISIGSERDTIDASGYINDDYPMHLPYQLGDAEITFDCSTRFDLNNSMSSEVWTKATDTRSGGFVRLGPDYRVFAVSMYHQLHCMSSFQRALSNNPGKPSKLDHHIQHCLNYLRQFILCSADDRLEPIVKVPTLKRQGCAPTFSRTCRNWGELYSFSERNYLSFHQYKVSNGSWTCELFSSRSVITESKHNIGSNALGQDAERGTTHKSSKVNQTAICKF